MLRSFPFTTCAVKPLAMGIQLLVFGISSLVPEYVNANKTLYPCCEVSS
jgi:hypothetical protein